MIRIDLFVFVMALALATIAAASVGAWLWGQAVKRDALAEKEWLLKNTVFKDTLMAELRAQEAYAQGTLALLPKDQSLLKEYWSGKLQAFQDVIVNLGGEICGK